MDKEHLRRASLITLRRVAEVRYPPGGERDAWLAFWEIVDRDGRFPMPTEVWMRRPAAKGGGGSWAAVTAQGTAPVIRSLKS